MNSPWLQRGLELVAAGDGAGIAVMLGADGADPADREQLAGEHARAGGDPERAVAHFSAALALRPKSVSALCGLGSALQAMGQLSAAADGFRRAAELAPDCVDALIGQGECSLELGEYDDARDCFEIAAAHAPDSVRARCGIGRLLRLSGDAAGSVRALQDALRLSGNGADLQFELGLSLNQAGDVEGAVGAYQNALVADPQHLGALVNLGLVHLTQLGEPLRAQQLFEAARAAHPHSVAAQANYGLALQEQARFDLALEHYERCVRDYPLAVEYRWNRALAYLYQGDFARGWPDYELRHTRGGRDVRRDFGLPEWAGDDPERHQILVYGEQGVGDEIMFASCLPELARNAAKVVLECDRRLAAIFARSFPGVQIHGAAREDSRDWLRQHPGLDRQIAIGSLPRVMRRRGEDFPAHAGYLSADPAGLAGWQRRLGGVDSLKIGVSWRGGTRKTRAGLRSLELPDCLPWAENRRIRFVCLQRGDCGDEMAEARAAGLDLQWWPEALNDIDETAALIAALDIVITVDNTVAHLAGALGRPCWTLLAQVPDWRYGLHAQSMPWYPSLRLFRQARSREWAPVVAAVARELAALPARR
jgi:tetratricopeptide (TPR) repeat protein